MIESNLVKPHAKKRCDLSENTELGFGIRKHLRSDFSRMRRDLNMVAQTYGYNRNNRYPNDRSGDWRNRVPFPLPF
ncbi:hypothetical protein [Leptolyngbya sp. 7M]|uniref:hypothetical protein n=1 Tax=Leptolyngbya sp. 7M TaxID=2812896 RepID=UPI001B8D393D|nr:hypothetical protein [Leptolyngbya sp. 7M]QYO67136.1 hypothetical protein JVX88_10190 [Leptolyngbya sp. 7M]